MKCFENLKVRKPEMRRGKLLSVTYVDTDSDLYILQPESAQEKKAMLGAELVRDGQHVSWISSIHDGYAYIGTIPRYKLG